LVYSKKRITYLKNGEVKMPDAEVWVIIAAIAAAVSSLCAAISIILTYLIKKKELRIGRPYFMIGTDSGVKRATPNAPQIKITLNNIGKRPASRFKCKIIIFDLNLTTAPILNRELSCANDLPAGSPSLWESPQFQVSRNVSPQCVIIAIQYFDTIINVTFTQMFFMKWGGVRNGRMRLVLDHARENEKTNIINYLRERDLLTGGYSWF
jgi:hypothetical protein